MSHFKLNTSPQIYLWLGNSCKFVITLFDVVQKHYIREYDIKFCLQLSKLQRGSFLAYLQNT